MDVEGVGGGGVKKNKICTLSGRENLSTAGVYLWRHSYVVHFLSAEFFFRIRMFASICHQCR